LRNHRDSHFDFSQQVNIIHGLNGSGKTTVLEAISLCAFTRTFLPTPDAELLRRGEQEYQVLCTAHSDLDLPYKVEIRYSRESHKTISSSHGNALRARDVVGRIPTVILSPDFKNITFGAPQDRRSFIDRLLSQCSERYMEDLASVQRVVRQRNQLLWQTSASPDTAQLDSWTRQLASLGASIVYRRRAFVREFIPYFQSAYTSISDGTETVSVQYHADVLGSSDEYVDVSLSQIEERYMELSRTLYEQEQRRGTTLFGPHRDDLEFSINGGSARETASQGQHKSLLICLKKAEFEYLKRMRTETPVLLLDDVFSELDAERTRKVFDVIIREAGQTLITTTDADTIRKTFAADLNIRSIAIEKGSPVMEH
jgi:DNA replication and repair protein RecF